MTVREILLWLANKDDTIDYDSVEKDIRSAVIREASVGVVSIKHDCTLHDTLERCRLTWIAEVKRGKYEDYDLIPRETP